MTDQPAAYERICPGCQKPFATPYPDKLACSPRCRQRARNTRRRDGYQRKAEVAQAVLVEVAPKRVQLPAEVRRYARTKMDVAERTDAYKELHARLVNSITDDVIDEMHGRDRIVSLGILEDKLEKLEARPAPAVRSRDRERVLTLLARLEERRARQAAAVDAQATEVTK